MSSKIRLDNIDDDNDNIDDNDDDDDDGGDVNDNIYEMMQRSIDSIN